MKDLSNINVQDINTGDKTDFYASFREKLVEVEQFPTLYTFKFIVPASLENNAEIEKIFVHPSTKIAVKDSKTGKYNSLTVETYVATADEVIAYYKQVAKIDKVIML
ncbi:DUF493 family protein [Sphingobacterium sp. Mn56C]|uniref:DUF493 family protein n=1 Tax=Sphingobacterium sp. Mn56C TaxID=3395261 RepID=UPI003BBAA882